MRIYSKRILLHCKTLIIKHLIDKVNQSNIQILEGNYVRISKNWLKWVKFQISVR